MSVVARWEWRSFGEDFETARLALASFLPERVEDSHETYLLGRAGDASVKVRDGRLDVKLLENVRDDGLEQWRPVMKAAFPVSGADAGVALAALQATGGLAHDVRGAGDLAAASSDLHALTVQ